MTKCRKSQSRSTRNLRSPTDYHLFIFLFSDQCDEGYNYYGKEWHSETGAEYLYFSILYLISPGGSREVHCRYEEQYKINYADRVSALHSIVSNEASKPSDPHEKPLLQYAAFYNSPACTLYLLQKGADLSEQDGEGKTVFHLCAYTGHVDVLKVIRNEMKLRKIRELSGKYVEMLMANNYKRTDMKGG